MMQLVTETAVNQGLGWNYISLNSDADHLPPTDRRDMLHYAISTSPIAAFFVEKCARYAVLVFTNTNTAYQQS